MSERWAPVPGTRGKYEASDLGRVRSLWSGEPLIMKAQPSNPIGHLKLDLAIDGRRSSRWVHRLVMEAFIGPCPTGMEVRHLDGNARNNVLTNLAYGTHSENVRDIIRHGRHNEASKTHCMQGHEFSEENTFIATTGQRVCRSCRRRWEAASRAKRRSAHPHLQDTIKARVDELKASE